MGSAPNRLNNNNKRIAIIIAAAIDSSSSQLLSNVNFAFYFCIFPSDLQTLHSICISMSLYMLEQKLNYQKAKINLELKCQFELSN